MELCTHKPGKTLSKKLHGMYRDIEKRNKKISAYYKSPDFFIFNEGYDYSKLHASKAYGCFIEDLKGQVYIDTALGAGTHILGYAPKVIVDAIKKQAALGTLYILPNEHTYVLGELLSKALPQFNTFVFCNTGSEATMRTIRIARAFTGKKKIGIFSGGWHGGHDLALAEDDYTSSELNPKPIFKSAGIPDELREMIIMLPYNNAAAFDLIKKYKDELALVIIEPSQGSNPRDDMKKFLAQLRVVTKECEVLLCFDEIISGFRIGLGGCQEYYGVQADLATYGKALGGGLPIGLIAGKKDIMQVIKGGGGRPVFMGGTFSANPLTMYVAKTLLGHLIKNRNKIYAHLNSEGKKLRQAVNQYCRKNRLAVQAMGIGSMTRLVFTDQPVKSRRDRDKYEKNQEFQNRFYLYLLLKKKVHVNSNRIIYLSMAHQKKDVEKIIRSLANTLNYFSSELKAD